MNQYHFSNRNNKLSVTYLILIIAPLVFGCRGNVKEENKNRASVSSLTLHVGDEKYAVIDTKESVISWKGASLMGSNAHNGYIYLSKGELMIENGQLRGGTIEVDMNTIEDKNHKSDNNLVHHLKDPDFFEVEKFPFSTIKLNKVVSINDQDKSITGNLTIKGMTHSVTFPAKIEVRNGVVKANGRMVIDRAKWNVRYKSAKFNELLADQTIADSIEFHMSIVTMKK
ncbi:MAG: YceI family protein [Pelobium sp.]